MRPSQGAFRGNYTCSCKGLMRATIRLTINLTRALGFTAQTVLGLALSLSLCIYIYIYVYYCVYAMFEAFRGFIEFPQGWRKCWRHSDWNLRSYRLWRGFGIGLCNVGHLNTQNGNSGYSLAKHYIRDN